jgi:hypothetical protein
MKPSAAILKKRIPFIVVSHDIWDSKAKEVLGYPFSSIVLIGGKTFAFPLDFH